VPSSGVIPLSWTAFGAIGELLGAAAVVVSLIYLSRQVRQNTDAVRTANAATLQGNFQALARVFYTDRALGALTLKSMSGESLANPEDRLAVWAFFFDMLKKAELAHRQFLRGELDADLWDASLAFYRAYFETPGFRAYWAERRSAFVPEFRKAMESWLDSDGPLRRTHEMILGSGGPHGRPGPAPEVAGDGS
jgi:hypothetical protein